MKKILSFLLIGLMLFGSTSNAEEMKCNLILSEDADDVANTIGFDSADEIDFNLNGSQCGKHQRTSIRSLGRSFGFAIRHSFSSKEEVILKKLPVHSQRVTLRQGALKLERGIYRLAYGVNLKNTGSGGTITTWLTIRPSHVETGVIIPVSELIDSVIAPLEGIGFSVVQVSNNIFLNVPVTSLISLNYSTSGDVRLSRLPRFETDCGCESSFSDAAIDRASYNPPNPFYLLAVKFANIRNQAIAD